MTSAVAIDILAVFNESDVANFFVRNYKRTVIKRYEVQLSFQDPTSPDYKRSFEPVSENIVKEQQVNQVLETKVTNCP